MLSPGLSPNVASNTSRNTSLSRVKDIGGEGSSSGKYARSLSTPASPGTPPTTPWAQRDNVWRSVFHPGSNLATKNVGADYFDRPQPKSPTVYDWLYSWDTRRHHG